MLEAQRHSLGFNAAPLQGQRPGDVRRNNRAVVLELLRTQPRGRAELARVMQLSKPTLGDVIGQLIGDGLVLERPPEPTSRGRHPAPLEINAKRYCVIGLDIASHKANQIEAGLYDACGQLLDMIISPSAVEMNRETTYQHALATVRDLIEHAPRHASGMVAAIGSAAPGPIDAQRGTILTPPNHPNLQSLDLAVRLERDLALPVRLERDVHAASVSYLRETQAEHFVYILLSKGIGASIVNARRVHKGAHGFAGEFGHVSIDHNGPSCPCGNRGCVERYASSDAIQWQYEQLTGAHAEILEIADRARDGQDQAVFVFNTAGEALGLACATLVNLIDPALIVLGGAGRAWADLMVKSLRLKLEERAYPFSRSGAQLPILIAENQRPIVSGAAESMLEAIYRGEIQIPETTARSASVHARATQSKEIAMT